jgi:hypothetical protein
MGTAPSPAWAPSCFRPGHLNGCTEPLALRWTQGGTRGHAPSTVHTTCVVVDATTENSVVLALRGMGLKRSRATCAMHASLSVFGCPTILSSTMARSIPVFGWRTTASRAGRVGRTTTFLSSSSSPVIWLTHPELGSITCLETRSIVGRISRRSLPATSRAHTCALET